jgi:Flp pilus assembly protein TadB
MMLNDKNQLDERQKARRNSIGNQMFLLMFYALLLDVGLSGAGIRWLEYPVNVMVILIVCMGIYLVRLIAHNAYVPDNTKNRKTVVIIIVAVVLAIALAYVSIRLFGQPENMTTAGEKDNSALILFIVSAIGLIIALVVALIQKANNRKDADD